MDSSAFDSTSDLLLCRLCLREYEEDYMHGIFNEGSDQLDDRIFQAVFVKPRLEDSTITICSNCKDLIGLIYDFQAACKHSSELLENQTKTLRSSTWKPSVVEETFSKAANLVQGHRKEVEYLLKINVPECDEKVTEDDFRPEDQPDLPLNQADPYNNYFEKLTLYARPDDRKIVCATCGELVARGAAFEGHMNRHTGELPFPCDVPGCEIRLHSKQALQGHKAKHRYQGKHFDCEVCGKRLNGKASWRVHQKIHTEEPKFECDVCGKKFRKKYQLSQHSTVHTGIAKFQCEICDKCFTIKHNLKVHLRIHTRKNQDDQKAETKDEDGVSQAK